MKKVELTYPNSRFVITTIGEPVEIRKYAGGGTLKKIKKQTKEPPTQKLFFWSSMKLKGGWHVWFCLEIYSWYYSVPLLIVRVDYVRALCCHHYISGNVDTNINNLIEKWHMLAYMARWGCLLFCSLQGAHFLKWRDPGSRGLWRVCFLRVSKEGLEQCCPRVCECIGHFLPCSSGFTPASCSWLLGLGKSHKPNHTHCFPEFWGVFREFGSF